MQKALFPLLQICLYAFSFFFVLGETALAQVTPDGTVNTQVTQNGNVAEITGGETRGGNLFHSFQDFSVDTGNEASFNNANDISNIFSRVTGGNISNIDGLISANGSADLFLINPAGIIFGNNARLDIGGSFYGSTATSILFEDEEFNAADLENPPLLTVNAPIGLGFRDNSGEIINRSFAQNSANDFAGLEVLSGNNLALVGGNINFEAGNVTARGGNIILGGLSQAGTVSINDDGSLSFPEEIAKSNISLSNFADVNAVGEGGGNITVNAQNLNLEAGEFGSSLIRAGISSDSTSAEAQAGDITVNVAENITLNDGNINNQVAPGGVGNSGNITINTGSLIAINGGLVSGSTFGRGNAGTVDITATQNIIVDGEDSESFQSGITSQVNSNAEGDSGGVSISTTNLNLTNGGQVSASTDGTGNAGAVDITATGDITVDGENSTGIPGGVISGVNFAEGDSGGINISTTNLNVLNGGSIDSSTEGLGNAGAVNITATGNINLDGASSDGFPGSSIRSVTDINSEGDAGGITIFTTNLNLTNGGTIDNSTSSSGNAGAVNITATDDITVDGEANLPSRILSFVDVGAEGDAGEITISTSNLSLTNGGQINANTLETGNAGAVNITATNDIIVDGQDSTGNLSSITSVVDTNLVDIGAESGNAGGINISTNSLNLSNGGQVAGSTFGSGNANNVTINASKSIFIDGFAEGSRSGILANALEENGNGGDVFITTDSLTIANGGTIEATNFDNIDNTETTDFGNIFGNISGIPIPIGTGNSRDAGTGQPGSIDITANSINLTDSARIEAATQFIGEASGNIDLTVAEDITLQDNSFISAEARGDANGGNLNIDTGFIVAFPGDNDIIASAEQGQGGNINITADSILGIQERPLNDVTNDLNASSDVSGFEGNVEIETLGLNPLQGVIDIVANLVSPDQTTAQACNANREVAAQNGLSVEGKGGVPPAPDLPLNSADVTIEGDNVAAIPEAVKTSRGNIQPARGIKVNDSGEVVLTAYRTDNAGTRLPEIKLNCGS